MKGRRKTVFTILIAAFIVIVSFSLPSIKSFLNQTTNSEFIETIREYALSANIKVVQLQYRDEENISSTSVSAGGSGVIFHKEGNKYYALTAAHVIEESDGADRTQFVVMGYEDLDFADALSKGEKYQGVVNYYQQFPEALIEYSNDKYDLAVISFVADAAYAALPVADEIAEYGDAVASMSNPHRKRNVISAGKINSRKPRPFGDETGKDQYPIIKHTSVLSEGSSGSALLNEDLEIVGINLGGGENIFRQYIYGMAMPSNYILDFLEEWKRNAH